MDNEAKNKLKKKRHKQRAGTGMSHRSTPSYLESYRTEYIMRCDFLYKLNKKDPSISNTSDMKTSFRSSLFQLIITELGTIIIEPNLTNIKFNIVHVYVLS